MIRFDETSTKTGLAGLGFNVALGAGSPPDLSTRQGQVQLGFQLLLAILQLFDVVRRERSE